jgi:hypothetical protein
MSDREAEGLVGAVRLRPRVSASRQSPRSSAAPAGMVCRQWRPPPESPRRRLLVQSPRTIKGRSRAKLTGLSMDAINGRHQGVVLLNRLSGRSFAHDCPLAQRHANSSRTSGQEFRDGRRKATHKQCRCRGLFRYHLVGAVASCFGGPLLKAMALADLRLIACSVPRSAPVPAGLRVALF